MVLLTTLLSGTSLAVLEPDRELRYPEFVDTVLGNGLRILLAEDHQQPAVFFRLLVVAGERDDPLGKEGLADLTAALLTEGAGERDAAAIAEAIDNIGGQLDAEANTEYSLVSASLLSRDIDLGLELFSDVIIRPRFPARYLARIKKQYLTELRNRRQEPTALARDHIRQLLFGSKVRLGREATEAGIKRITVDDIRQFHQTRFRPNNSLLLVIGDFQTDELRQRLVSRFADWTQAEIPPREHLAPVIPGGISLRLVNKPDLSQGTIAIGLPGIPRRHPDEAAYRLMSYILVEGGFSSRLYNVVRAKEGRTYHVGSLRDHHPECGTYGLWTFTRNDEVVKTWQLIQTELRRFITEGITEEELRKAKAYYTGNIPLRLETPDALARRVLDGLYYQFTLPELRQEVARLNQVTVEKVNRVARQYLNADNNVVVIVGNARKIGPQLVPLGRFTTVDYRTPVQEIR